MNGMLFPAMTMTTVHLAYQVSVSSIQGYDRELGYGRGVTVAITRSLWRRLNSYQSVVKRNNLPPVG